MKNKIRQTFKLKRSAMNKTDVGAKSIAAQNVFLLSEIYKNSKQIMLYMPLGNETDTSCIINTALNDGKKVVLPVTDALSGDITPYYANDKTQFRKGAFSVLEPFDSQVADMSKTDIVLVPGIAFAKNGARIGFGKGCYDRFLKKYNVLKIGFCYDFQICDLIAHEPHDINMDYLITETKFIKCDV